MTSQIHTSAPGTLIVISGPSGVGKGTICKALCEGNPDVVMSISATTRAPRPDDIDGVTYFFLTEEAFKAKIEEDAFLEYASVHGHYYGTPKAHVNDTLQSGKDVILEIDVDGAAQVRRAFPDALTIFILPPSLDALNARLSGRGTETEADKALRMNNAIGEIKEAHHYGYIVINDDLDQAVSDVMTIIRAQKFQAKTMDAVVRSMLDSNSTSN